MATLKAPPNKASLFFCVIVFLAYFLQQPTRREDWPLTYFGMYKGGRINTRPFFQFQVNFESKEKKISLYDFPVDYYFVDEKLREILLGTKEDFNNDQLNEGHILFENKREEIESFLRKNFLGILERNCPDCGPGKIQLRVRYWEFMEHSNYSKPERDFIYASIEKN